MKTTVNIAPTLLKRAKQTAAKEGTTLRALVDEGLRAALARRQERDRFTLRDASFDGHGLQPGIEGGDWKRILELTYEGRGG